MVFKIVFLHISRGKNCKLAANVEKNVKLGGLMHFDSRNIFILKGKGLEVKVKVSQVIKVIWQ